MKKTQVLLLGVLLACAQSCTKTAVDNSSTNTTTREDESGQVITEAAYNRREQNARVSSTITVGSTSVKIYSYDPQGTAEDHVAFKYGDLLNRAATYKNAHPSEAVEVKFVMYKFEKNVYVGFNPDSSSYGYVKNTDFAGDDSERLIWSVVKAAKNKVQVKLVFHNPTSDDISSYLNDYMNDFCYNSTTEKVSDYLQFRRNDNWYAPLGGQDTLVQQHNKFMLVNKYATYTNALYITSNNIDLHTATGRPTASKDWTQCGTLLWNNAGLYNAYSRYFDKIFDNYNNVQAFWTAVRSGGTYNHANGNLNYSDANFSAYFYPMPVTATNGDMNDSTHNAWVPAFNPVAAITDEMVAATGQARYVKINMYNLKTDPYGNKFISRMHDLQNSANNTDIKCYVNVDTEDPGGTNLTTALSFMDELVYGAKTHCKNYTYAFSTGGTLKYYSITGSTNAKKSEYCFKANNALVIKETTSAHPVYDEFKAVFEDAGN
jgi:hypothetical protein